jgi:hypothetical protein
MTSLDKINQFFLIQQLLKFDELKLDNGILRLIQNRHIFANKKQHNNIKKVLIPIDLFLKLLI